MGLTAGLKYGDWAQTRSPKRTKPGVVDVPGSTFKLHRISWSIAHSAGSKRITAEAKGCSKHRTVVEKDSIGSVSDQPMRRILEKN
jgi:hypothetical protein